MPESKNKFPVLFIVYFILINSNLFGQYKILYPRFLYEGFGNEKPLYILFHDSIANKSDTVWLYKINPFNNLPFSSIGKEKDANFYYHLTASEVRSLLPAEIRAGYEPERRSIPIIDSVYTAGSHSTLFYQSSKFVAIGFTLEIFTSNGHCIGVIGEVRVFNSNNEQIFAIEKLKTNVGQLGITNSGDYLSFNYGYSDEFGDLLKCGFRIYDINRKRLIVDKGTNINGFPMICNDLILNGDYTFEENTLKIYYIFSSNTKTLYSKKYKSSEPLVLRGSNNDGFIFIDSKGNIRTEVFSSFDQQSYE